MRTVNPTGSHHMQSTKPRESESETTEVAPDTTSEQADTNRVQVTDKPAGKTTCNDCDGHVVFDAGEYLCTDCGLVHDLGDMRGKTSLRREVVMTWSRGVGHPTNPNAPSFRSATEFLPAEGSFEGQQLHQYFRARKLQDNAGHSRRRNLSYAVAELRVLGDNLELPDRVVRRARQHYREAYEEGITVGDNIDRLVAASVLLGVREEKCPYTARDIAQYTSVEKKMIVSALLKMCQELDLDYVMVNEPEVFLPRLQSELEFSPQILEEAEVLIEQIRDKGDLSGKNPTITAAAALYTVGVTDPEFMSVSQKAVAELIGCSGRSIRLRYKELLEVSDYELPEDD